MKLILLSTLVLATIAFVDSAFIPTATVLIDDDIANEEDCRPNESFRECGNAAICDWTCVNRNEPYITCPPVCVRRCICDAGFVRNGNGECINENECPIGSDY